jgi:hypothetical protein
LWTRNRKELNQDTNPTSPTSNIQNQLIEQKKQHEEIIKAEREKTFALIKKLEEINEENKQASFSKKLNLVPNDANASIFYKSRVMGILEKTYQILERELLSLRLEDIARLEGNFLFICENCHKFKAVFECFLCKLFFCKLCLQEKHTENHKLLGKDEPLVCLINEEDSKNAKELPNVVDCQVVWRNECYEKVF